MQKGHGLVTLFFCALFCARAEANGVKKIKLEPKVGDRLDKEYRLYQERNFFKMANQEVNQQIREDPMELFEYQDSVVLPLCNFARPPYGWRYISASENEKILKNVASLDAQFLRWTDSVWVRVAGSNDQFRQGMYCGEPYHEGPVAKNYIPIQLDQSFAENIRWKNTPSELVDGTLLQIGSKKITAGSQKVSGEVVFGVSVERPIRIGLEIWSVGPSEIKRISSMYRDFSNSINEHRINVFALLSQDSQAHLIMRLHPRDRDDTARGDVGGTIYLLDARLAVVRSE